jgi:hypothetical protein
MFLDNKEEFQTVWQLAHNWVDVDPDKTDTNAVSIELKNVIHRLLLAITSKNITARTRRWAILEDDSIFTSPLDFYHRLKLYPCLRRNKFNKSYLDNLYIKRDEVINWCANVAQLDPPPCWSPKNLFGKQVTGEETKNYDSVDQIVDIECNTASNVDTSQQREAAHVKHKPVEGLKKECIYYWLQRQKLSNDHVAQKFYEGLPPEKQKLLSPSNASKTLSKAISQYKNREKLIEKSELPRWLINFNPEDPQT